MRFKRKCDICNCDKKYYHGMSHKRIYNIWNCMIQRCKISERYKDITVCERWEDFKLFYNDVGLPPTNQHQLHRVNNDGNYTKENTIWVTPAEHGEIHAKFKSKDVKQLREDYKNGKGSTRKLAEIYGISKSHVHAIVNRQLRRTI